MTFVASKEATQQLVDMSIGISTEATVSNVKAVAQRFGKKSEKPFLEEDSLIIELMNVQPTFSGIVKFRKEEFGPYMSFPSDIYLSELNAVVPPCMRKGRIKSDFFEIVFTPHNRSGSILFLAPARSMSIPELANGLRVAEIFSNSEEFVDMEIEREGSIPMKFPMKGFDLEIDYQRPLKVLEESLSILHQTQMYEQPKITWPDVLKHGMRITFLHELLTPGTFRFRSTFSWGDRADKDRTPLFILFHSAIIGDLKISVFVSVTGQVLPVEDTRCMMLPREKNVERIIFTKRGERIDLNALTRVNDALKQKYETDYAVFSLVERSHLEAEISDW